MRDILIIAAAVAAYFLLTRFILPKLGIPT